MLAISSSFASIVAAVIGGIALVLVALIGIGGRRRLQTIEVNTNHRLDVLMDKLNKQEEDRLAVAAIRLAEAKAAPAEQTQEVVVEIPKQGTVVSDESQ